MTEPVDPNDIERIVGAPRSTYEHMGAIRGGTVYIMHSKRCVRQTPDLRECDFSRALDLGLRPQDWDGQEEQPVVLRFGDRINDAGDQRLVPLEVYMRDKGWVS